MSNLTAIELIANNSAATTGLWNQRLSTISANFAALNSDLTINFPSGDTLSVFSNIDASGRIHAGQQIGIGAPPSAVTTAVFTIAADSTTSDYIHFEDSSAGKSNYGIGSRLGGTADGLNLYDLSGDTMIVSFSKQSIRFFQNVVGKAFDTGGQVFNVAAYGARGNGIADDTSAIQAALDDADILGGGTIYFPSPSSWYVLSSALTIPDGVGVRGDRAGVEGSTNIRYSQISRSGRFPIFGSYGTKGGTHVGGLRITDVQLNGGAFGSPLLDLHAQTFLEIRNVRLFDSGGSTGMQLVEVFDSGFYNMYVDFCGSAITNPAIAIYSGGSDNCNQLRFVDCDLESNLGCMIASVGSGSGSLSNNELYFTRCKFENNFATSQGSSIIRLDESDIVFVENCTFTAGNTSLVTTSPAAIVATGCDSLYLSGYFEQVNSPTTANWESYISLSDCDRVEVAAVFSNVAAHSISGDTAIVCTTGIDQLDVLRSKFINNSGNKALAGPSFSAQRRHTAVDVDSLSIGTVGLVMTPTSGRSYLAIGASVASAHVHVVSAGVSAASQGIMLQDVVTNNATKVARLKMAHSVNTEEPVSLIIASSGVANNTVIIGGGSGAENAATLIELRTSANTTTLAGTARVNIRSGGTTEFTQPVVVPAGSAVNPAIQSVSEVSLGWYRSGVSTVALSYGTFNLATNAVRLSMRTLAASAITASAANTNVAVNEVVFTVGGASGASLAVHSGGTVYIFDSVSSAKAT